eukprot:1157180-Pelagomonas_calceolata.AAC.4
MSAVLFANTADTAHCDFDSPRLDMPKGWRAAQGLEKSTVLLAQKARPVHLPFAGILASWYNPDQPGAETLAIFRLQMLSSCPVADEALNMGKLQTEDSGCAALCPAIATAALPWTLRQRKNWGRQRLDKGRGQYARLEFNATHAHMCGPREMCRQSLCICKPVIFAKPDSKCADGWGIKAEYAQRFAWWLEHEGPAALQQPVLQCSGWCTPLTNNVNSRGQITWSSNTLRNKQMKPVPAVMPKGLDEALSLANAAPNSLLLGFSEATDEKGQVYYIVRVEFDGTTAGMFGSAIETRNVIARDGIKLELIPTCCFRTILAALVFFPACLVVLADVLVVLADALVVLADALVVLADVLVVPADALVVLADALVVLADVLVVPADALVVLADALAVRILSRAPKERHCDFECHPQKIVIKPARCWEAPAHAVVHSCPKEGFEQPPECQPGHASSSPPLHWRYCCVAVAPARAHVQRGPKKVPGPCSYMLSCV